MKKLILIAALLFALPAEAGDYLVFRGGNQKVVDDCVTDTPHSINGDVWIPFVPINGDMVIQHYGYSGTTLTYTYVPPVPPNPQAFVGSIAADPNMTAAARLALLPLLPIILSGNSPLIYQGWADVLSQYGTNGSGVITSQMQTDILKFADSYGIELVPQ